MVTSDEKQAESGAPNESFVACVKGLASHSEAAIDRVWSRYAPQLHRRVEQRLYDRTRALVDAEDVVQSAFNSFFRLVREDRYELKNWFALWKLLVTITDRKCMKQNRRSGAQKRRHHQTTMNVEPAASARLAAREAGPLENAIFAETLQRLFETRDVQDRDVIWLYLRGAELAEIATTMQLSERSIQRCVRRAIDWLQSDISSHVDRI